MPGSLSVEQLKEKLDRGEALCLLDVRTPAEHGIASLGGTLIPLGELPARYSELDSGAEIVVYCHHGVRSHQGAVFLERMGFTNVKNLSGGIDQWSIRVDPDVPRY